MGREIVLSHAIEPPRLDYPSKAVMAVAGLNKAKWKLLTDTVYPSARTADGVLQAALYCRARNLDPMKRCVHVVPIWNSTERREVETVWPGIAEFRTTASRTGLYAGIDDTEFGPDMTKGFKDKGERGRTTIERHCDAMTFPEWGQVTVYKLVGGQRVPFRGPKVYFEETFSGQAGLHVPNDRWQRAPRQMLEKCAEAAALRRAFPEELGNAYAAEEMAGRAMTNEALVAAGGLVPVTAEAQPEPDDQEKARRAQRQADERWVEEIRQGVEGETVAGRLEQTIRGHADDVAELDDDLREKVAAIYEAGRARLSPATIETDDEEGGLTAEDIADYREAFGKRLREKPDLEAVEQFRLTEAPNLGELPETVRLELERMVDDVLAALPAGGRRDAGGETADGGVDTGRGEE